jgi:hypothetical protein
MEKAAMQMAKKERAIASSCGTRAVKVLRYIESQLPKDMPRSSRIALREVPANILAKLH